MRLRASLSYVLSFCFGDGGVDSRHNRTFFEKQMPIFVGMMQVLAVNAR
jgi:hypothetical protein